MVSRWEQEELDRAAARTESGKLAARLRHALADVDVALADAAARRGTPEQLTAAAADFRVEAEHVAHTLEVASRLAGPAQLEAARGLAARVEELETIAVRIITAALRVTDRDHLGVEAAAERLDALEAAYAELDAALPTDEFPVWDATGRRIGPATDPAP